MEKFYAMAPAIVTLGILAATMWYPFARWKKNAGEQFNSIAWRKQHAKEIFFYAMVKTFFFTIPWQTLVFFAPLIFVFDHLTVSAWIACVISRILVMTFRHGTLWRTQNEAKLSDDDVLGVMHKEPETDHLESELARIAKKYPRKMFRRKLENSISGLIQGTLCAAFAIWTQSIWKIFLLQVFMIPALIIATLALSLLAIGVSVGYEAIEDRWLKR